MKAPKRESGRSSGAGAASDLSSRDKLLKSAETLFAAKGFREVSVREIAAHAGVNSALVGYYFHGKQALFNEVYRSHAAPLAKERMERLAALMGEARRPSVEEIVKAWIMPWLRIGADIPDRALHVRITANLSGERWEHTTKAFPLTQRVHDVFVDALRDCLPFLSRETLLWRLHFIMGAIAFGLRMPGPLRAFSKGRCDPTDLEMLFAQIVPFAVLGFTAPETDAKINRDSKFQIRN
jgi:AcrR family transcriptional regulator